MELLGKRNPFEADYTVGFDNAGLRDLPYNDIDPFLKVHDLFVSIRSYFISSFSSSKTS